MKETAPSAPKHCYWSASEVAAHLGIHPKTLNRKLRLGLLEGFPAAILLDAEIRRWKSSDVEAWVQSRPRTQPRTSPPNSATATAFRRELASRISAQARRRETRRG